MKPKKNATPMDAALDFLTGKARTVRETERHLDSKNYGEYEVYQVVERLKELGYLDDEKYARDFVQTRLATKPLSRRKLREQLMAHELDAALIDAVLSDVDEDAESGNALQTAQKYYRQFQSLEESERLIRVGKRLATRGYDYETIKTTLRALGGDEVEL